MTRLEQRRRNAGVAPEIDLLRTVGARVRRLIREAWNPSQCARPPCEGTNNADFAAESCGPSRPRERNYARRQIAVREVPPSRPLVYTFVPCGASIPFLAGP